MLTRVKLTLIGDCHRRRLEHQARRPRGSWHPLRWHAGLPGGVGAAHRSDAVQRDERRSCGQDPSESPIRVNFVTGLLARPPPEAAGSSPPRPDSARPARLMSRARHLARHLAERRVRVGNVSWRWPVSSTPGRREVLQEIRGPRRTARRAGCRRSPSARSRRAAGSPP
jgi:hypothetical protein